jgi:hypothetical protein
VHNIIFFLSSSASYLFHVRCPHVIMRMSDDGIQNVYMCRLAECKVGIWARSISSAVYSKLKIAGRRIHTYMYIRK